MDVLSDALRVLRITGAVFLDAEFSAPWCVLSRGGPNEARQYRPWENLIFFHLLTAGRCAVRLTGGGEILELESGDVVMLPRDDDHLIGSNLRLEPRLADTLIQPATASGLLRIEHGGGGEKTRFGCGYIVCDERLSRPLLETLPRILRVRLGEDPVVSWLRNLMQVASTEFATPRLGSEIVRARLSELVFVEVLRRYAESLPASQTGWLAGLRDRHVGRALALMHGAPERTWSVDELGEKVGLSRSALAQRFTSIVGLPPVQYLTRWRLTIAAHRLGHEPTSLARLAADVGYESDAAFNHAFKREFGVTPAAWRRSRGVAHGAAAT